MILTEKQLWVRVVDGIKNNIYTYCTVGRIFAYVWGEGERTVGGGSVKMFCSFA